MTPETRTKLQALAQELATEDYRGNAPRSVYAGREILALLAADLPPVAPPGLPEGLEVALRIAESDHTHGPMPILGRAVRFLLSSPTLEVARVLKLCDDLELSAEERCEQLLTLAQKQERLLSSRPTAAEGSFRAELEYVLEMIDLPEKDCRCGDKPPCDDCVENGGLRLAVESARASLAALPAPALPVAQPQGNHPSVQEAFTKALAHFAAMPDAEFKKMLDKPVGDVGQFILDTSAPALSEGLTGAKHGIQKTDLSTIDKEAQPNMYRLCERINEEIDKGLVDVKAWPMPGATTEEAAASILALMDGKPSYEVPASWSCDTVDEAIESAGMIQSHTDSKGSWIHVKTVRSAMERLVGATARRLSSPAGSLRKLLREYTDTDKIECLPECSRLNPVCLYHRAQDALLLPAGSPKEGV